jgi:hypothetical protein
MPSNNALTRFSSDFGPDLAYEKCIIMYCEHKSLKSKKNGRTVLKTIGSAGVYNR